MKMKYNFHALFVLDDFTIILNCAGVSKLLTGSMYFTIQIILDHSSFKVLFWSDCSTGVSLC